MRIKASSATGGVVTPAENRTGNFKHLLNLIAASKGAEKIRSRLTKN